MRFFTNLRQKLSEILKSELDFKFRMAKETRDSN